MKHKFILPLLFGLLAVQSLWGQWTALNDFDGASRSFANAFTIGERIYLQGGFDGTDIYADLWEYHPGTDTWTQKADFPGGFRRGAVCFSMNGKGYMGTGSNGFQYLNDFWEYDPTNDTWTQKADFGGDAREEAVGFAINGKGYIGTGQQFVVNPNNSFNTTYNDFWEYNLQTNTWTQKAALPGNERAYAVGVAVNGRGYVGLGGNNDQTESYTDFYEYDPINNTWLSKSAYPGTGKADAGIFAFAGHIFVLGGIHFPSFAGTNTCKRYYPGSNTWANEDTYDGGVVIAPVTAVTTEGIFVGTGADNAQNARNDWWKFVPGLQLSVPQNITPEALSVFPNPCAGKFTLTLPGAGEYQLRLVDAWGKTVWQTRTQTDNSTQTVELPPTLAGGLYTLLAQHLAEGNTFSQKIVNR